MNDQMRNAIALKARYVFPAVGRPIADAAVTILGERIVAVGGVPADAEVRDLGNVAILPGLVNAHTHLEFSHLAEPLGREGGERGRGGERETAGSTRTLDSRGLPVCPSPHLPISFTAWLRSVTASRRSQPADSARAVEAGLRECLRLGTTTLGEIAQPSWSPEPFRKARLDATVFLELIGPTPERAETAIRAAEEHAQGVNPLSTPAGLFPPEGGTTNVHLGLSPHAPYSVRPELLAAAVELSCKRRLPLAFHLAESREELELIGRGTGPLRDFLAEMAAWQPDAVRPGARPLDYLRVLAAADRVLVIHGNYLDDEEIAFLAEHRDRMAVVYCPRTHAWFGHDPYPLERMLEGGVTVGLGTDSLASSPDLSVLSEMRFVARHYPRLPGEVVFQLGTIRAAAALGRDREVGSLEPGKRADLAVVALDDRATTDPCDLLFNSQQPVVATWVGGRVAWASERCRQ